MSKRRKIECSGMSSERHICGNVQPPGRWRTLLLAFACAACARAHCERRARGAPPDGRFALALTAEPDSYVPGEVYTVSLVGIRKNEVANEFSQFLVIVENSNGKPTGAGSFQVYDSMTKIDPKCPNQVSSSNGEPKSEIQVLWTAPPPKSGCVTIKAMVQEAEVWFMDEGPLRKRLCEASPDLPDNQPPIVNPCCACDEAKYEVTFEGLWSRHTHPKDFPASERATKFSDVIGASHTVNYRFWEFGRLASEGLREVAEYGATTMLEKELKAESEHIRTIIKARGIGYPNLNGKTFAVFRVDNRHHLISLVSMISPSPDWIVGVSGLELCLTNCTWVESKVLNLYPYDAGTDSGVTYLSADERTFPPEPVRALRAVSDPLSPFHGPDGKPLARLYLARQRLYEKSCDVLSASSSTDEDASREACAVRGWAAWSACSTTCGAGTAHRQRAYRDAPAARAHGCRRPLTERRQCYGDRRHCRVPSEYEPDPAKPWGPCAVSDWSGWSPCTRIASSACARGLRTRTRRYLRRGASKRCHQGYRTKPELDQTDYCIAGGAGNCTDYDYEDDTPPLSCPVTEWGPWSPCSATCGMGWKMRTRFFIVRPEEQQRMFASLNEIWKRKFLSWQKQVINKDLGDTAAQRESESAEQYIVTQRMEECKYTLTMQETMCVGDVETCKIEEDDARKICILPKQVGPCRAYMERWFFDTARRVCEPFGYTGCQGNRNNFNNRAECERVCARFREELMKLDSFRSMSDGVADAPSKGKLYDIALQDAAASLKYESERTSNASWYGRNDYSMRDCIMSEWGDWSSCLGACGQQQRKHRSRSILQYPANGGRLCPKKLLKHKKCKLKRC